jgi:8-oxo-dGTP pyrophosphatase MutT (NUDIX family)
MVALKRFGSVIRNVIASRAVKGKDDNRGPIGFRAGKAAPEATSRSSPIAVGVELIQDLSAISSPIEGFLRRHRHRIKTLLSDGTRTDTYVADYIDRAGDFRDAVAIAIFARQKTPGETLILLRRQVRYAAWISTGAPLVTEVPAGVLELPETPEECAQREVYEETGIEVGLDKVRQLGRPFYILPGTITERLFAASAEVSSEAIRAAAGTQPMGDGSPFEEGAELVVLTLADALSAIAGKRSGATPDIMDSKTELLLRRLKDALSEGTV